MRRPNWGASVHDRGVARRHEQLSLARIDRHIRRLQPLYHVYRRHCAVADEMDMSERIAFRDKRLARLFRLAIGQGIACTDVTEKTDIRDNPDRYARPTLWPVSRAATGGTTGIPLRVRRSLNAVIYEQATIDHVAERAGLDLARARVAVFRGDNIKAPDDQAAPFWVDRDDKLRIFSSIHLSDRSGPAIVRALHEFKPDLISCYPSSLQLLLSQLRRSGVEIRPRLVMTSSEFLPQQLFADVQASFGCPLLDYYGQAERVCFAWATQANHYRFRHDYGQVILSNPGLEGKICGANYRNAAHILINYNTGDVLAGADDMPGAMLDAVELGIETFAGIEGRIDETMALPDGRQIVGFNQIPRLVDGADYVQFVRTGDWSVDVVVVRNGRYSPGTITAIERNLASKIPGAVQRRMVFADVPLRTASGKAPVYLDRR